ncbi:MAG: substrate-binding domain-containing protein [Granulosicoccus sp.]
MSIPDDDLYLTTKELASLLRIKERKVYDMASAGDVPCVRAVGKLLFPRDEILRWLHAAHSGPQLGLATSLPVTLVGSHDPLLEWAMRESQCGLASFCDGSRDGLERMARFEAQVCGTHLLQDDQWNTTVIKDMFPEQAVVLVEFAQRQRGLIMKSDRGAAITSLEALEGLRVARRQASAASESLFSLLLERAGLKEDQLVDVLPCARTEDELGMLVFEGKADAAFGLASVAARLQLDFVPQLQERFDLLVWRKAWFDEPFQTLLRFLQSEQFFLRAEEMGGYNISSLGCVRYNSPAA